MRNFLKDVYCDQVVKLRDVANNCGDRLPELWDMKNCYDIVDENNQKIGRKQTLYNEKGDYAVLVDMPNVALVSKFYGDGGMEHYSVEIINDDEHTNGVVVSTRIMTTKDGKYAIAKNYNGGNYRVVRNNISDELDNYFDYSDPMYLFYNLTNKSQSRIRQ